MKKSTSHFLVWVLLACATFATQTAIAAQTISLLSDNNLSRGLMALNPEVTLVDTGQTGIINGRVCPIYRSVRNTNDHVLSFANLPSQAPIWTMAQWHSSSDLLPSDGAYVPGTSKLAYVWRNDYKKVLLGKLGSGYATITLGLNGEMEYKGKWPSSWTNPCIERPHPHLLISQNAAQNVSLGSMQALYLNFAARVLKSSLKQSLASGWNMSQTTAHFKIHINFSSINRNSKGQVESFGFDINFFDIRNRDQDYASNMDSGCWLHKPQQRIICTPGLAAFGANLRKQLHAGQWGLIQYKDVLPLVKTALSKSVAARKNNSFISPMEFTNPKDFALKSINFGWEVSSLHDVEMQVNNIRFEAVLP